MPEYLAPGVYVEETSFRPKSIEGVSTSTAGFVGPTRFGPTNGKPELLTSFADFERIYGGLEQMVFLDGDGNSLAARHNFLAHGVRAFFEEGGRRCYVARVFEDADLAVGSPPEDQDGHAIADNADIESPPQSPTITFMARFPGRAGNMRLTFTPVLSDNLLVQDRVTNSAQIRRVLEHDTVIRYAPGDPTSTFELFDVVRSGDLLALSGSDDPLDPNHEVAISSLDPASEYIFLITMNVSLERPTQRPNRPGGVFEAPEVLEGFKLHPEAVNAITGYFVQAPSSRRLHLTVPFSIDPQDSVNTGYEMAQELLGTDVLGVWEQVLDNRYAGQSESIDPEDLESVIQLEEGHDGQPPGAATYRGDSTEANKSGFASLEDVDDISIVAAPGYSYGYVGAEDDEQARIETIQAHLINHAERMRYRIAVLDSPNDMTVTQVKEFRGQIDSKYAAIYYPWVCIFDDFSTGEEIYLPPSGFMAGIYARNDVDRGVQKAPANEVVRLAVDFEFPINKAQQDVLNPEGVNCFRIFNGRGRRIWGARTISSDPEWKYVNIRRYFAYLERSIDEGTQWVVFESNGERLWDNVRRTIESFLFNEWKSNRLRGLTPEEAYFVKCDRTTMTQNNIDNGQLICLIGVAPLYPAEFVIFRIGQKLVSP